jgi:hypothetical protein
MESVKLLQFYYGCLEFVHYGASEESLAVCVYDHFQCLIMQFGVENFLV